ncbi:MAG: hypothetical protein QS721_11220 [Candidatus Endonucleobacter sp. (ex Gigantidas childressi)]|nr:hypothetical protein [Candidatus Endonucleobacter sp. (ex Gigantidas childressi)]
MTYHVVDNNLELFQIGKNHAKSMGNENGVVFRPSGNQTKIDLPEGLVMNIYNTCTGNATPT